MLVCFVSSVVRFDGGGFTFGSLVLAVSTNAPVLGVRSATKCVAGNGNHLVVVWAPLLLWAVAHLRWAGQRLPAMLEVNVDGGLVVAAAAAGAHRVSLFPRVFRVDAKARPGRSAWVPSVGPCSAIRLR